MYCNEIISHFLTLVICGHIMMENKNSVSDFTIAIIGSRGIPNNYGGFEGFTEKLSVDLVEKDYDVMVSSENSKDQDNPKEYKGVNIFYFPLKPPKSGALRIIYEVIYDGYSILWASKNSNYIYMLGYGAAVFFFIPHLFGKKLLVNPGGLEWKRNKFNPLNKFLLKVNERLMAIWADEIIADSKAIKKYIDAKYDTDCHFIPYGVCERSHSPWDPMKLPHELREISRNNYWLLVARLEPENNIHLILEAYQRSGSSKPLVIVGDFSSPDYEELIEEIMNNKPENKLVFFTGGIYNQDLLNMLRENCYAHLHGHSVGGTNPSLLEAMIMKNIIIAHDNPFNREVCGDSAIYFQDAQELTKKLDMMDSGRDDLVKLKNKVYKRVKNYYSWPEIVQDYIRVFSNG